MPIASQNCLTTSTGWISINAGTTDLLLSARTCVVPWRIHKEKNSEGMIMKIVRDILLSKGDAKIYSVEPGAMVVDALKLMAEKMVGALLVLENGQLAGVFSERDYARKIALMDRSSRTTEVRQVMTADLICVSPADTMEYCMELMTEKHIRHLPVLEYDKLIGMISIGDLVKNIIEDQKAMIFQLEKYMRGETY
jgi:CBS domain-containing protein